MKQCPMQEHCLRIQEEAEVTPGEQQVPPVADDGRPLDTPLLLPSAAR